MAVRDRADRVGAWGGLVFYRNGQAEPILYPYSVRHGATDLRYVPDRRGIVHLRNALCRFNGHFEQLDNASRAGPDAEELRDARNRNFSGLILTSLPEQNVCAHYYTPQGVVVSLGKFRFR